MKIAAILLFLALALSPASAQWVGTFQDYITPPHGIRLASKIHLFNGQDFSGWKFFPPANTAPEKTWSITNGVIHCQGTASGYLRTENTYSNALLVVEWRFLEPGTAGVLVDMQPPDQAHPPCVECAGTHNHEGDVWLWGGAKCQEPKNLGKNGIRMLAASAEHPIGEWNTFKVLCQSNTVEFIVNDQPMNKITGGNLASGFIGFTSEGADVEIQEIVLCPLK